MTNNTIYSASYWYSILNSVFNLGQHNFMTTKGILVDLKPNESIFSVRHRFNSSLAKLANTISTRRNAIITSSLNPKTNTDIMPTDPIAPESVKLIDVAWKDLRQTRDSIMAVEIWQLSQHSLVSALKVVLSLLHWSITSFIFWRSNLLLSLLNSYLYKL